NSCAIRTNLAASVDESHAVFCCMVLRELARPCWPELLLRRLACRSLQRLVPRSRRNSQVWAPRAYARCLQREESSRLASSSLTRLMLWVAGVAEEAIQLLPIRTKLLINYWSRWMGLIKAAQLSLLPRRIVPIFLTRR